MKYSEAEKQIKALSSKYDINMENVDFAVNYKNKLVAWVKGDERYLLYNVEKYFKKLPFSDKLYMILAELAITPLDERIDEKKYRVKAFDDYLNLNVDTLHAFLFDKNGTGFCKTCFTLKEIEQLKQRDDIPLNWDKVKLEEVD